MGESMFRALLALGCCVVATSAFAAPSNSVESLQQQFLSPPDDSRPMVRWWWFGPAVTHSELEHEMKLMKEGGFGGFEVQPTYPLALDGEITGLTNLKFMSPAFLDALHFTAAKAKELGLRMDLTLGSGWPYGGPEFSATEGATSIITQSIPVAPGQHSMPLPRLREGQSVIAAFVKIGKSFGQTPIVDNTVQIPPEVTGEATIQLYISRGGIMAVKRPAYGADGHVIDHYSPTVIEKFITEIAEPEIKACEPNPPYSIFCDSLEVNGENWTPNFPAEFKKRRSYDLVESLPNLFGSEGDALAELRHDWGQTITELFNDYFNKRFTKLAHDNHTRFRIQGYGTPPAALSSYAYCDLPEGEGYNWKGFTPTRWSSSAAHLLGKPVASSETLTWLHSPVFRATPLDMKAEANLHFLCGINQLICHGWPYTPEGVAYPGWSFYAAGAFNEKNPWWIVMPEVTKYLQRVSFMLRQGTPVSDVALYLPTDDAWSNMGRGFSLSTTLGAKVSDAVRAISDAGYNLDFFDDELLAMRGTVESNKLAFEDVHYRAVVLPDVEEIPLATITKLEEFARAGGTVIATHQLSVHQIGMFGQSTSLSEQAVGHLFKDGGILVHDESQLGAALASRLKPDVAFSPPSSEIGYVHRHTDAGEVYFLVNTSNEPRSVKATFRDEKGPGEIWNPMTGNTGPAMVDGSTIELAPYESTFVVFTGRPALIPKSDAPASPRPSILDLSTGWTINFGKDGKSIDMDTLKSWSDVPGKTNFSGVATYTKTITIGDDLAKSGLHLVLDFGECKTLDTARNGPSFHAALEGPIREAAIIYINDKRAGSIWSPPYSLAVDGFLKAGENEIRIEVANTAMNYMAGIKLPNYNYAGVTKKFGNRFQPQQLDLVHVLPSGLLGPIRLVARDP
jgi:hypothetical protein